MAYQFANLKGNTMFLFAIKIITQQDIDQLLKRDDQVLGPYDHEKRHDKSLTLQLKNFYFK